MNEPLLEVHRLTCRSVSHPTGAYPAPNCDCDWELASPDEPLMFRPHPAVVQTFQEDQLAGRVESELINPEVLGDEVNLPQHDRKESDEHA